LLSGTVGFLPIAAGDEPVTDGESASEAWFVMKFDGKPVGFERVKSHVLPGTNPPQFSRVRRTRLKLQRLGQDLTVEATLITRESLTGHLLEFSLQRTDGSGTRIERSGRFLPEERGYQVTDRANASVRTFDLQTDGVVQSPIVSTWLPSLVTEGVKRVTRPVLFPESMAIADVTAETRRNRRIHDDQRRSIEVTPIHFYPQLDPLKSTQFFVDTSGAVVRQEKRVLGGLLSMELTTADQALAAISGQPLDLDVRSLIPIDRLLSTGAERQQLVIDLTVKSGFLNDIPEAAFQKVSRIDASTLRVTLTTPELPPVRANTSFRQAKQQAIPPTRWMQLEDPILQRMAATGSGGKTSDGEVCQQLERFVQSKIRHSAFSINLQSAADVARTLRGDCTEHAVLLAALMRVNGIPSRVVGGLVHTNRQYGFMGHVWVEALVEGQWVPFDSATSAHSHGTTHLKLTHSNLNDETTGAISLFLPVLDLAGRAAIKVVSQQ